jgi:hypothetical protein
MPGELLQPWRHASGIGWRMVLMSRGWRMVLMSRARALHVAVHAVSHAACPPDANVVHAHIYLYRQ